MLDTETKAAEAEGQGVAAIAETEEPVQAEDGKSDEELADEVIVEISVDGMCGVY